MDKKLTQEELLEKATADIKAKVESLRKDNPKLKQIYPIIVFGDEYDEKPVYVGYFKQPPFTVFSKYLSAMESNQAVAMRALATDCFIAGDKELIDDDSLFLFGLMGQIGKIIKVRNGQLANL
jgi:hypothetical protein